MVTPILFLFISLLTVTVAQSQLLYHVCSYNDNYTIDTTYQTNLDRIFSSLTSNTTDFSNGFFNFSSGEVNSIALCRGDINPDVCRSCLNDTTFNLPQLCPNQKEAIVWYDYCMLAYSNRSSISGDRSPTFYMRNNENASDVDSFNSALGDLLNSLRSQAAAGNSLRKFATGEIRASFQTIFALVQCIPKLSNAECNDCVIAAVNQIPEYVIGKIGGRVINPSCNFRYEITQFYQSTGSPPPQPSSPVEPPPESVDTPTVEGKKSNATQTIIIIVVSVVLALLLMVSICIFLKLRRKQKKTVEEDANEIITVNSLQFDFAAIKVGTDNFSDANKLGQGGFGAVYKGKLSDGQYVAVKRLSKNSGQGDLEFKNEVLLVAKLQHRNLVRLLGFSLEGQERLLIYEFVANTSLDHFIFDRLKRGQLDWERRYKIIGGVARGLLYLHEDSRLRIIHRDLKASNILLDEEMNPKISDFGMARLFALDQTQGETSRIVGTYGYMAPEYAMHGNFSVKSDVYSFGVLVLEMVSGRKNSCFHNGEDVEDLICYAWRNWSEGTTMNVIDPLMKGSSRSEMMRCIHIGLLCTQENIDDRPTMAATVLMLNSYSTTLAVPKRPAFFINSSIMSDNSSSTGYETQKSEPDQSKSKDIKVSQNDATITELYPR